MISSPRTLIVVPSFNEEANLPALLPRIREVMPEAEILVIDDGSRDGTERVARAGGARVARHRVNLGYGAALQTGYRYADRHGFDVVMQIDADGQHDPGSLLRLREELVTGKWDVVLGSRFLSGARKYRAPLARRVGMKLFGSISGALLGRPISDPTTGFQALSGRLVRYHARGRWFPADYPDADVLIRVGRAGFRITEIPVTMYEKDGPSMHSGWKPVYYVMKMLLSIAMVLTQSTQSERAAAEALLGAGPNGGAPDATSQREPMPAGRHDPQVTPGSASPRGSR